MSLFFLLRLAPVVLGLSACASSGPKPMPPWVLQDTSMDSTLFEQLRPGDTFEVKFRRTPELDATVTVSPDGRVQLPIVGSLLAAGYTPTELELAIERGCQRELKDPDAIVIVTGFEGRAVHVGGEVNDPGRIILTGPTTPLEALIQAGGPLETAAMDEVLLVRLFKDGDRRVFAIDLEKTLADDNPLGHLRLIPSDVLLVPRTGVANLNIWIDQYIRQNIPINLALRPDFNDLR